MSEKVQPDPIEVQTHDAQLIAENIVAGEEKAPEVDFDADYDAAKAFSVGQLSRVDEEAAASDKGLNPQFQGFESSEPAPTLEQTSDPDGFRSMAKEVNPRIEGDKISSDNSGQSGNPGDFLEMARDVISQ